MWNWLKSLFGHTLTSEEVERLIAIPTALEHPGAVDPLNLQTA